MEQDHELVERHRGGDKTATSALIEAYQDTLYGLVFRLCRDTTVTQDIVQDSFVRAFERIHQFKKRSSFKSWLCRIAINLTKNYLGSYQVRNVRGLDNPETRPSPSPDPAETLDAYELRSVLAALVDQLPPRQRISVILRIFEELSFAEISEAMNCPFDTAKANFRHGILRLKTLIFEGGLSDDFKTILSDFN
jgi:RNA polymerase sigma-70 factor (ECF subfamily)